MEETIWEKRVDRKQILAPGAGNCLGTQSQALNTRAFQVACEVGKEPGGECSQKPDEKARRGGVNGLVT